MSYSDMTTAWRKVHFDKDKRPKTLQVAFNSPTVDSYHNVKEGNIILTILAKENTQGFQLSTGDLADFIEVLTSVRKSLLSKALKMQEAEK